MMKFISISGTVNDSIVDGPGIRFTIFVQGCPHRCRGCHNPQTHAFDGGKLVSMDSLVEEIRSNPLLDGVTFSGGEPFCQADVLADLGSIIKESGLNIITYTGYTFEELIAKDDIQINRLLYVTDYLIDGSYVEDLKSYQVRFRGSSNQRIIDVQKSLECGCVVECLDV